MISIALGLASAFKVKRALNRCPSGVSGELSWASRAARVSSEAEILVAAMLE